MEQQACTYMVERDNVFDTVNIVICAIRGTWRMLSQFANVLGAYGIIVGR